MKNRVRLAAGNLLAAGWLAASLHRALSNPRFQQWGAHSSSSSCLSYHKPSDRSTCSSVHESAPVSWNDLLGVCKEAPSNCNPICLQTRYRRVCNSKALLLSLKCVHAVGSRFSNRAVARPLSLGLFVCAVCGFTENVCTVPTNHTRGCQVPQSPHWAPCRSSAAAAGCVARGGDCVARITASRCSCLASS